MFLLNLAFSYQVNYLSAIQHRNIVSLLGYCQENNLQFLVYEYIHSGSVSSHLYGNFLSFHHCFISGAQKYAGDLSVL